MAVERTIVTQRRLRIDDPNVSICRKTTNNLQPGNYSGFALASSAHSDLFPL